MTLPLLGVGPTRTGGGALDPNTISGLTLYLDANDLATLWQTDDTSTPVASDGQAIGRWLDKSAGAKVLTQATANERPTWRNAQTGANGRGTLVTPNSAGAGSDWLGGSVTVASLFGAAQAHLFVAFYSATVSGSSDHVVGDSAGFFFLRWPSTTQLTVRLWNGTAGQSDVTIGSLAAGNMYIAEVMRDATPTVKFSINGASEQSVATAGNLNFGGANFNVPVRQAATKHGGWVGHVLAFSRALTTAERNQVGQWLAGLYGVTWTNH